MTTIYVRRQAGLTFISLIFVLALIGFFVLLILKIGPIYLDHHKVASSLAALNQAPELRDLSEFEIRDRLNKLFNMNYVYDVNQDDVKIVKHDEYLKITINYEVVKKIAGNLSVLVEFNDVLEQGKP
jgi:hypothetical protein